jgi:hypothetical protein
MKIRSNEIAEKVTNLNTTNDLAKVKIEAFDIVDHGIEHCQYFQGDSAMFTRFDATETGCGDNFAEALDDALESLAQSSELEIDFEALEIGIKESLGMKPEDSFPVKPSASDLIDAKGETDPDSLGDSELYYYVSFRYSLPKGESK